MRGGLLVLVESIQIVHPTHKDRPRISNVHDPAVHQCAEELEIFLAGIEMLGRNHSAAGKLYETGQIEQVARKGSDRYADQLQT